MENSEAIEKDKQRAEIFDALGHPTRITILKALSECPLGFADLKKKTGIQSSGHLQHHINKLNSLVKTDEYGKYCLSDHGKDALLSVETVEYAANSTIKRNPKLHLSKQKLAALLLISVIATTLITGWTYDRINTHEKWATMLRVAQEFYVHTDNHEIDDAFSSIHELQRIDQAHTHELSKIDSFIGHLRDPDLDPDKVSGGYSALRQIGHKVVYAYGSILNYTSMNYITGPSFWYFGPSSPNETLLQEAVVIAVNAESLIS